MKILGWGRVHLALLLVELGLGVYLAIGLTRVGVEQNQWRRRIGGDLKIRGEITYRQDIQAKQLDFECSGTRIEATVRRLGLPLRPMVHLARGETVTRDQR